MSVFKIWGKMSLFEAWSSPIVSFVVAAGGGVGGGVKMPVILFLLRNELTRRKNNNNNNDRAFAIKVRFNKNVQKNVEILFPNFQQLRLGGRREGEVASYPRKMHPSASERPIFRQKTKVTYVF